MVENSFVAPTAFSLEDNVSLSVYDSNKKEIGTVTVEDGKINFFSFDEGKNKVYTDTDEFQNLINDNDWSFGKTSEKRWIKYNPNPKKHNTTDCTMRAYCKALNMEWKDAYDMAVNKGREMSLMPNDAKTVSAILADNGYVLTKFKRGDVKRTVNEFAVEHPTGTYILDLRAHVVAVVNGRYYDSWDSGSKKIKGFYSKD